MEILVEMRCFMVFLLCLAMALAKPSMDDDFAARLKVAEMGQYQSMGQETYDDDEASVSVEDDMEMDDHHFNLGDGMDASSLYGLEMSDSEGVTSDFYQSFMVAEMADILMDSPLNTEDDVEGRFFLCKKCLKKYVVCKNICKSLSSISQLTSDMVPCSTTCLQRLSACCFKKFTVTKSALQGGLSNLFQGKQTTGQSSKNPHDSSTQAAISATQTAPDLGTKSTVAYRNPLNLGGSTKFSQGSGPNLFQNLKNPFGQGSGPNLFQNLKNPFGQGSGPNIFQNLKNPFGQGSGPNLFQNLKNPFQQPFPWAVPSFHELNPFQGFPKPNFFGNENSQTVVITSTVQVLVSTCQYTTDTTLTSIPEESVGFPVSPDPSTVLPVLSPHPTTPTLGFITEIPEMPSSVYVPEQIVNTYIPPGQTYIPPGQ